MVDKMVTEATEKALRNSQAELEARFNSHNGDGEIKLLDEAREEIHNITIFLGYNSVSHDDKRRYQIKFNELRQSPIIQKYGEYAWEEW